MPQPFYFTSDNHFGHKNIIKYSNRPFKDVEEMDEKMIELWNKTVQRSDAVYLLGDFAFANIQSINQILSRLNGQKHLILGNHDQEINNNFREAGKHLISIQPYKEIKIAGQKIILFHYGCRVWNQSHRGSWLLYGHSHGTLPPYGKSVDVGVDSSYITGKPEYRPYSFDEIEAFMNTRTIEIADQHTN